ncbi:rab-GTPase-TBC domain-domain-containing protein [Leucosporidium creatinivorum]|uniref:Rab-GTPase-TBC domain-domain-containing protein n=1 Tax=Leucosporidium creatinivorum TaxID=106004 RepID=A0A1Y2FED5_9BASI|nr:rab-GTPase-TBC domain-domain-containing protein [Leucosporidium creatinivorum]
MDAGKQPRLGTSTPNVLQKLVSMTRQRDLPPKAKEEEKKHLRELEEMRTAAKEAEKRRQATLASAAAARTARIASAFPTWESSILPNWRVVLHHDSEGLSLRKLWWEGTMPVRWRGRLWGLCVGNGLAVSKGSYSGHLDKARKAVGEGRWEEVVERLERDVEETLPTLKLFQKGGVMHDELVDVLLAYTMYASSVSLRPPRYPVGIACPAAMLLVNMPVVDAWVSLVNLVNKSYLKSFYSEDTEECEAYCRIFDTLLADSMPKIYENFSKEVVRPALYLAPWLTSVYVRFLPLDLATRIFDIFLLEGDSFLFRVALVLLQILEPRLFNPVQAELDAVFKGSDRGAVAIVRRQRASAGAGEDGEIEVQVEEVYTEMGVTEEAVFRGLEEMVWREETWDRLVTRELPEAD